MTWVLANDLHAAVATYHLALLADLFHTWANFHLVPLRRHIGRNLVVAVKHGVSNCLLLIPVGNSTSAEVVGSQFHLHLVARQNPDVVHPHLSGDMGQHLVAILELDAKHRVGQRFSHRSLKDDRIFFRFWQDSTFHKQQLSTWRAT